MTVWHEKTVNKFQEKLMLNSNGFINLGIFHANLDFRLSAVRPTHWKT